MKKERTTTLRNSMWRYFVFFTAIIFVMLWVFQIMLFRTYYETMKKNEISAIGQAIAVNFEKASSSNVEETLGFGNNIDKNYLAAGKTAFESGVTLNVFDENGNLIIGDSNRFHGERRLNLKEMNVVREKILNNETNTTFKLKDGNFRTNIIAGITSAKSGDDKVYFYIKTPMIPMNTTVKVLQNQLIMCTVTSLLIAFIAAYFVSNSITKPIKKMTNSAKILATGNYNVEFEGTKHLEICELSDALNYAARELSKTDTLRRDLMANVSHDLKTPLTIIKSYAEMIRDLSGNNPAKREVHTQVIIDETDRLTSLVSDILDLSCLEAGTVTIEKKQFDLCETANTILDSFKIFEENEGYVFETDFDKNALVFADENRISQVIYNLINNAINYTGEDKKIIVKIKNNENKVRFEVSDTGCGIEENDIDKVWDRYYKSSKTHKRMAKGTGIGLSIVKNILIEHNADYGVISRIGSGSTFWFEI